MGRQSTVDVRTRRRDATRSEILDAAWALAERDGLASLSLRDLAAAVGMRAPSLYTYFDSKAAIYDAMFAQGYRELEAATAELPVDPADVLGSITAHLEGFLAFCTASLPRYQLMFTRAVPGWEPGPDAYAVSLASYAHMAEQLERLGVEGPEALDLLTALTSGLAAQQLANDPTGDRWVRLAGDAAQMFLTHVHPTAAGAPDRRRAE
jgi:AcrR family transcriptional regulator